MKIIKNKKGSPFLEFILMFPFILFFLLFVCTSIGKFSYEFKLEPKLEEAMRTIVTKEVAFSEKVENPLSTDANNIDNGGIEYFIENIAKEYDNSKIIIESVFSEELCSLEFEKTDFEEEGFQIPDNEKEKFNDAWLRNNVIFIEIEHFLFSNSNLMNSLTTVVINGERVDILNSKINFKMESSILNSKFG